MSAVHGQRANPPTLASDAEVAVLSLLSKAALIDMVVTSTQYVGGGDGDGEALRRLRHDARAVLLARGDRVPRELREVQR